MEPNSRNYARYLIAGGSWAFAGKMLAMAAGVAANAMLTRLLSPDEVGTYFLIMSIGTVAALVAQMGLGQVVVRYIAEASGNGCESRIRDTVAKSFMVVMVTSALIACLYAVSVASWGVFLFHASLMSAGSILVAGWIVLTSLRMLAVECLRGFHDIRLATFFEGLLTSALFLLLMLWIWMDGQTVSLHRVIMLVVLAALVSAIAAMLMVWMKVSRLPYEQRVSLKELLRTGIPLLISNLTVVLMTTSGLWAVGFLTTTADTALYGTAVRLAVLLQFPLLALNAIVPPMVASMHARNETQALERILRMLASASFVASVCVMSIFTLWGKDILGMLFGSYYAGAYWILLLLGMGVVVNAWAGFCGPVLMMTGYQKELMRLSLTASVITLPVTVISGSVFGAEGVAAGMSFGMALLHVLMLLEVRRKLGIRTYATGMGQIREVFHAG